MGLGQIFKTRSTKNGGPRWPWASQLYQKNILRIPRASRRLISQKFDSPLWGGINFRRGPKMAPAKMFNSIFDALGQPIIKNVCCRGYPGRRGNKFPSNSLPPSGGEALFPEGPENIFLTAEHS